VARPHDWPRVLISHHHSDHSINLGHLLITRWIVGQNVPFEVWGPPGMARQVEEKIRGLASHRTQPEDIGRVAAGADAGKLVITHLMPGSVPAELESAAARCYGGPIVVGQDLQEV
jgi:ribonuclease BN (tRNA processing enzyme)